MERMLDAGIHHNDIHFGNIVESPIETGKGEKELWVIDFGLARMGQKGATSLAMRSQMSKITDWLKDNDSYLYEYAMNAATKSDSWKLQQRTFKQRGARRATRMVRCHSTKCKRKHHRTQGYHWR